MPSQASWAQIFWFGSKVSPHFLCFISLLRLPEYHTSPLFFSVLGSMFARSTWKQDRHYSLKPAPLHNSFHSFPLQTTWVVGCRGCCSDIALVLAVKWSICRYVCLHHRHPLTHSLLHSPDEPKRLIYSGFKDTAFSPIWLRFPGGSVFPFESQPNRLWWHLCVLHESTTFRWEKYACSVIPAMM